MLPIQRFQKTTEAQRWSLSDGELADQALAGDQQAFEALVQRYYPALLNFIHRLLGDYDLARDILQQVFLRLYLALPTLSTGKSLKSWLFRVAHNQCIDELRRKRYTCFSDLEVSDDEEEEFVSPLDMDSGFSVEETVERRELQRHVLCAIQQLPARFRRIVYLRYASQMTFAEIGQQLHMPETTAKTYFQRAKPLLRASL